MGETKNNDVYQLAELLNDQRMLSADIPDNSIDSVHNSWQHREVDRLHGFPNVDILLLKLHGCYHLPVSFKVQELTSSFQG